MLPNSNRGVTIGNSSRFTDRESSVSSPRQRSGADLAALGTRGKETAEHSGAERGTPMKATHLRGADDQVLPGIIQADVEGENEVDQIGQAVGERG